MAQTRWIRDQGRHRSRNVALFIMAIMCVAKEVSGFVLPTLLVPSPVSETTSIVTTRPRWCARSGRLTPRPQVPIVQMSENHEFHDDSLPSSIETDGATVISLQSTRSSQGSVQQVVEDAAKAVGGSRAVRKVARVLPGTWLTAGLPKWMHTMRRRMITKEDYFHLHAASGLLYLLGGSLWLCNVLCVEVFSGVPQLETDTPIPLILLGAGLFNILSAWPMAHTRSWIIGAMASSIIQLWQAWYVSGAYPAAMAPADPWLAAAGLSLLVIAIVEAEEAIARDARARELIRSSRGKWRRSGRVTMHVGDEMEGATINRFGTYASFIFNAPHLYATLVGGGWVERLAEAYPGCPALLFHAYFALGTSTSIALLAPTLYARGLVDAKKLSAMQFITAAPLLSALVDVAVMGSAATNNPLEIYLRFLS